MKIENLSIPIQFLVKSFLERRKDEIFTVKEIVNVLEFSGEAKQRQVRRLLEKEKQRNNLEKLEMPYGRTYYGTHEAVEKLKKKWGLK